MDLSDGEQKKMSEAKHMQRHNSSRAREQQYGERPASCRRGQTRNMIWLDRRENFGEG
jgi:hypothetical protein